MEEVANLALRAEGKGSHALGRIDALGSRQSSLVLVQADPTITTLHLNVPTCALEAPIHILGALL